MTLCATGAHLRAPLTHNCFSAMRPLMRGREWQVQEASEQRAGRRRPVARAGADPQRAFSRIIAEQETVFAARIA